MKIAIIGQQDFGKAVLDAFLARGDSVAGVFVAPEKEGGKPDPMKIAAQDMLDEVPQEEAEGLEPMVAKISAMPSRVEWVALAICGAVTQFGRCKIGSAGSGGSGSVTSRPAAKMVPSRNALASAS